MKNLFTSSLVLLLAGTSAFAQNNVQLVPASGNVCFPMPISLGISGNSFTPTSYLWSTGETSPVIEIVASGTYTLTVTGEQGNSGNIVTHTKSATYNVLPVPSITALTDLWVCKGDTVKLQAVSGYDYINWSNGTTGTMFSKKMNLIGTPGTPALDTMTVSYTAGISGKCSTKSQPVLLRAIRKPHGVGQAYHGKMNIRANDSIPAGLVLEYLYPVTYEMAFTDMLNPSNVIKYVTAPGSRKAPASMLTPGNTYSVETTPIINNKRFCSGMISMIGIAVPSTNRLGVDFTEEAGVKTFRIYDMGGRVLMEKQAENFDRQWLMEIPPQIVIVHKIGTTTEVIKMQISK